MSNIKNDTDKCCCFSGPGLIIYSAILAIIIGQNMDQDELNLLSNLLQAVGQNLGILSAVNDLCNDNNETSQEETL